MALKGRIAPDTSDADIEPVVRSPGHITTLQRMISACLGSFITSLVVTPFDVIRIRIQQQQIMPELKPCCDVAASGSIASSLNVSAPNLFWMGHNYCTGQEQCTKITSTYQGFVSVGKNEGFAALWRGLSLNLAMAIPSNIIYFTGYEYIKDHSPIAQHPLNPLLCGAAARTVSATMVSPVELIKTRLQAIPSDPHSNTHALKHLLQDLVNLVKQNGVKVLFKGLQITLWRDVPFSGIYWLCYEVFKANLLAGLGVSHLHTHGIDPSEDWKIFVSSFISGCGAGLVAALFTNPFDVGKTRLQITSSENSTSAAIRPPRTMFGYLASIYRNEGIGALYAGFGPRAMKVAPSCAIMISSYEIGKKIFINGNTV